MKRTTSQLFRVRDFTDLICANASISGDHIAITNIFLSQFAAAFMNVPASGSTAEQRAPPVCMNLVLAARAGRSHSGNTERSKFIHPDQL